MKTLFKTNLSYVAFVGAFIISLFIFADVAFARHYQFATSLSGDCYRRVVETTYANGVDGATVTNVIDSWQPYSGGDGCPPAGALNYGEPVPPENILKESSAREVKVISFSGKEEVIEVYDIDRSSNQDITVNIYTKEKKEEVSRTATGKFLNSFTSMMKNFYSGIFGGGAKVSTNDDNPVLDPDDDGIDPSNANISCTGADDCHLLQLNCYGLFGGTYEQETSNGEVSGTCVFFAVPLDPGSTPPDAVAPGVYEQAKEKLVREIADRSQKSLQTGESNVIEPYDGIDPSVANVYCEGAESCDQLQEWCGVLWGGEYAETGDGEIGVCVTGFVSPATDPDPDTNPIGGGINPATAIYYCDGAIVNGQCNGNIANQDVCDNHPDECPSDWPVMPRVGNTGSGFDLLPETSARNNQCPTRVNCPGSVEYTHDCSWEPSLSTVCADQPGDGTGVGYGVIDGGAISSNPLSKDLYCEIDTSQSLNSQKNQIRECVRTSGLPSDEKQDVINKIN